MLRICEATVACHVVIVSVVHEVDPGNVELHLNRAYQAGELWGRRDRIPSVISQFVAEDRGAVHVAGDHLCRVIHE